MRAATAKRWNSTQGAWLALALLVHALLLLLPLRPLEFPADSNSVLTIQFSPLDPVEGEPPPNEPRLRADEPHGTGARPAGEKTVAAKGIEIAAALKPATTEPGAQKPRERLSLARLIDSLQGAKLDAPVLPRQRQLGSQPSVEMPSYWRAGPADLPPTESLFSGMANPAQTEIVDRWLAADGSHNVVVNLPNGETLCGRAPAWDPMRPLVENVMAFRNCGGGKRTFDMPQQGTPEFRFIN